MRRLRATNLTALLAGTWTLLGMLGTEALLSRLDLDKSIATGLLNVVDLLVFFLVPVLIFVVGIPNDPGTPVFSTARLKWQGIASFRMLCWFLGCMIAAFSIEAVEALFHAVVK
jgi:hypothetical protein